MEEGISVEDNLVSSRAAVRRQDRSSRIKPLPCSLNLLEKRSLTRQLVSGIREAISTGYYQSGELLPSFMEMSAQLGVSLIVVRHAIAQVAAEGLVLARHGYGILVLKRASRIWKGKVLFITNEHRSIYFTHFIKSALRRRLMENGYLFESLVVEKNPDGTPDLAQLGIELNKFVKLVILYHDAEAVARFLSEKGVPFVAPNGNVRDIPGMCGVLKQDFNEAIEAFAAHARRAGIRRVWQVGLGPKSDRADIVRAFDAVGIPVIRKIIAPLPGFHRPESYERSAMVTLLDLVAHHKSEFPELLYFTDDYVASGALTALLSSRVSIPKDVKVVAFSNCGHGPVFPKELTRIEVDARQTGEAYAESVLSFLRGEANAVHDIASARYVIGETFPLA